MTAPRWLAALVAFGLLAVSVPAQAVPGPPQAPQWWFDNWNVPALWSGGADGRAITVALLDSGVQADLPELAGRVLPGADFSGAGTDGRTDLDGAAFSHGTAMASLIVASPGSNDITGVAPGAKILPVTVDLAGERPHAGAPPDSTSSAIRWAVDHGARVISMSFGGSESLRDGDQPCPGPLQDAVIYALRRGALLLAASGNQGRSGSPVTEPGVCLGVVAVGSVNQQLDVSGFSSRHPYLSLSAPGEQIASLSRSSGAAFLGFGTSQATALAAGAVADVWSWFPTESGSQILSRILGSAQRLGAGAPNSSYGYGFIEPARAIAMAVPTGTNPVFAAAAPLLDLAASPQQMPAPIAAAGRPDADLGSYRVAAVPSRFGRSFWLRCLGAVAGSLLMLGFGGVLRRGRVRRREVTGPAADAR